jgi:hypothetical protein
MQVPFRREWRGSDLYQLAAMCKSDELLDVMASAMDTICKMHAVLEEALRLVTETPSTDGFEHERGRPRRHGRKLDVTKSLEQAFDLLLSLGRILDFSSPPRYAGLHDEGTLRAYKMFHRELRVQLVLAPLRERLFSQAEEALDEYWEAMLNEHRAAATIQAACRGKLSRNTIEAFLSAFATPVQAKPGPSEEMAKRLLNKRSRYEGGAERAAFHHLLRAVQASQSDEPRDLYRALRPTTDAPALSLDEVIPNIQEWLCGLTSGLSVYQVGRIVARRKAPNGTSRLPDGRSRDPTRDPSRLPDASSRDPTSDGRGSRSVMDSRRRVRR